MKLATSLAGVLVLAVSSLSAATLAFQESGTSVDTANTGIIGFNFTVSQSINVTELGFFGSAMGGGDTPKVTLNDTTNNVVLETLNFAPVNGWVYQPLSTPITLTPGTTYQVTASAYWSPQYADASGFTYGPEILTPSYALTPDFFGNGGWGWTGVATTPVSSPNIAANFRYEPVPEPGACLLAAGGLSVLLHFRRRTR